MNRGNETLVILSPGFAKDETDTTCLPSQQIFVKALNKNFREINIVIIALHYPYREDQYLWFGNTVISLNGKGFPKFLRPWLWIKAYYRLTKIDKQTKIAGVLSFWCHETALLGKFFASKKKIKHFIWLHGQDARSTNSFVRWINPGSENLIALSDFLADEFERNHNVRPKYIIPNGIDPTLFSTLKPEKQIDVLGVGSLIPLKQYSIFIDVVYELVKYKPTLRAALIGAGPEEKQLRSQIARLNLEPNITLVGEIPHEQVINFMLQSKILLHPSSYEGYSTVCLEALYAACHVVSFQAAENTTIHQWHIVKSKNEMIDWCKRILLQNSVTFAPVLRNTMEDSAKAIVRLFLSERQPAA